MTQETLWAAKLRFAKSDMRKARREGEIMIAQTVHGLVTLTHDADTGTYEARKQLTATEIMAGQMEGTVIFSSTGQAAVNAVAGLYRVA